MTNNDVYADRLRGMVEDRASPENPSTSLANPAAWLVDWAGGAPTAAGVNVNAETAMRLSAVYSCVRILSETLASLPLCVYERLERGKRKATDHPLYAVLHDAANPELPSFYWREVSMNHLALRGNAYAEITRTPDGRVAGLYPIHADAVTPKRLDNGQRVYTVQVSGRGPVTLRQDQVLHVPGLGFDGLKGMGVVTYARNSLGLTTAAEDFGARFLANGVRSSGVLQVPHMMKAESFNRLRDSFASAYAGSANTGKPIILEDGATWTNVSISPNEAQYLETRQFQIPEICRWFRVPPHLVYDLSRATFSNIEHQSIEFVTHSIRPWLVRWESVLNLALFSEAERRRYFVEFNVDGLMRGDIASRYAAYAVGRQWGWLSADDVREIENMNPLPDGQGDVYLVPLNMTPADRLDDVINAQTAPPPPPAAPAEPPGDTGEGDAPPPARSIVDAVRTAYKPVFADALARITRREVDVLTRAARRGEYRDAVVAFYRDHAEYVRSILRPVVEAFAGAMRAVGADAAMDLEAMVSGHCESRREQVLGGVIFELAESWQAENDALAASMIEVFPHE